MRTQAQRYAAIASRTGQTVYEVERSIEIETSLLLLSAEHADQAGLDIRAQLDKIQRQNLQELIRLGPALQRILQHLDVRAQVLESIEAHVASKFGTVLPLVALPQPPTDSELVAKGGILSATGKYILPTPEQVADLVAQRKADWKAAHVEREAAKAKATAPKPPGWDDPGMAELRARAADLLKKYPPKLAESQSL